MRILTYSDLHLEFGSDWALPPDADGDILLLAGDIISFADFAPLHRLLRTWHKPVLYVAGNHEYYTERPMNQEDRRFQTWLEATHPNVKLLIDDYVSIGGVQFFGGTMWTDFNGRDGSAMEFARNQMNDFRLIQNRDGTTFRPSDAVALHAKFVEQLQDWFAKDLPGPRVVVTHNAPVVNPKTQYGGSPLMPAFNSLDMLTVIATHQPALWVYGHTHECDDQVIGETRIISNQLGYPNRRGGFECVDFDAGGRPLDF